MPEEGRAEAVETPEAPAEETPEVEATTEAPESSPTTDEAGFDAPLKIEELPEDQQAMARRLEAQFKSAYTRARQRDTQARPQLPEGADEAMEFWRRVHDDETSEEAINELAEKLGYTSGDEPAGDEPQQLADPRVDELLERENQRQTEQRETVIRNSVADALVEHEEQQGELGDNAREAATLLGLSYVGDDGLPDMDRALTVVDAIRADAVQSYIASKKASGDTPNLEGGEGVAQDDLSTRDGRLKRSLAIAGRHSS